MTAQRAPKTASAKTAATVRELRIELEAAKGLLQVCKGVLGDDEQAVLDLIEGQTDVYPLVERIVGRINEVSCHALTLKGIEAQTKKRRERFEEQEENLRTVLLEVMTVAQARYLELPVATLSVTPLAPGVEIVNEAEIPARFWKRGDPKLDKVALKAALKNKEIVPGACLDNGSETLAIRCK